MDLFGFAVDLLRICGGFAVKLLIVAMGLNWIYYGFALGLLGFATDLLWICYGIAIELQ